METRIARINKKILHWVEHLGLAAIAVATVVAGITEVMQMLSEARVTLADLLLMFLYLEVLAMVGLHYEQGKLPVRFPIYIAMVALARYLIIDVKNLTETEVVAVAGSIVLLALAVLAIRFGHLRYPYPEDLAEAEKYQER
jgi:protein PsiE